MKAFFTTILAIACAIIIILGHSYWKNKTTLAANEAGTVAPVEKVGNNTQAQPTATKEDNSNLTAYTKNWPTESQSAFQQALKENRPFKILLLGSNDLGQSPDGWAYITKDKLINTFGSNHLDVGISEFNVTSTAFVLSNKQADIAKGNWDLILFEPFTFNDNGLVKEADSLQNLTKIMADIKSTSPKTIFILQPPHPIYNGKYLPIQVNALKQYAQSRNIAYLDHWTAWPNSSNIQLKNDLTADQSAPNSNGHRIWSDFVIKYLLGQN
jgi:lysophospholipase L1-like esterase